MKQDLEKYLKGKRFQLDVDEPDDTSIWEGIKAGMGKKQHTIPAWFWKVAAIFLLIFSTTYVVINETAKSKMSSLLLANVSEELGRQEAELQLIAEKKWDEVRPYLSKNPGEFKFLLDELIELENVYTIYSDDLTKEGANEYIIRALLDCHEKKIKTLDRILLEIQKQQNHEEQITL